MAIEQEVGARRGSTKKLSAQGKILSSTGTQTKASRGR
jgi:hypothetical protein